MVSIGDVPFLGSGNDQLSSRVFDTLQGTLYLDTRLVNAQEDEPYDIRATAKRRGIMLKRTKSFIDDSRLAETKITPDKEFLINIHDNAVEGSSAERFLFGHELGHIFLLECMQGAIDKRLKTKRDMYELTYGTRHRKDIEYFCDYFAQRAEAHRKA